MYKVGIIGTGDGITTRIKNWQEVSQVSLAGFYFPGVAVTQDASVTQTLYRYSSLDELIDACDIIDIIVPAADRFSICEKAIRKGRHVLIEKPMAYSMTEAEELVKLVKESNVKLQVSNTERFNPAYLSLKSVDLRPLYIESKRQVPFHYFNKEGNLIFDFLIQDIDTVLTLVQSEVKNISASGVAVITDAPDLVSVRIEFNNGCVATLTASRLASGEAAGMQLFQKNSIIHIDFLNKQTQVSHADVKEKERLSTYKLGSALPSPFNPGKEELHAFVSSIQGNTRTVVNEIDGYRAMEIAHQIQKKINSNLPTVH